MTAPTSQPPRDLATRLREAAAKRYREPPDGFGFPSGPITTSGEQLTALERGCFIEGAEWALNVAWTYQTARRRRT